MVFITKVKSKDGCILVKETEYDEYGIATLPDKIAFINFDPKFISCDEAITFMKKDVRCSLKKVNNLDNYFECLIDDR